MSAVKPCALCKEVKPLAEFHSDASKKDGHISRCRICTKLYYKTKKEIIKVTQKKYWGKRTYEASDKIKAKNRLYRKMNPEKIAANSVKYRIENKPKLDAQKVLQLAVKRGDIKRLPCEVCGAVKGLAHHDDYSEPLIVRFLCQRHHSQWHAVNGESPNGKTALLAAITKDQP